MPRRAILIALVALFSLGLLSVYPVIAQTAQPVTPTAADITALKEEVTQLHRELAEDRMARKEFALEMRLLEKDMEGWHTSTKTISELMRPTGDWVRGYFNLIMGIIAILFTVFVGIIGGLFRREVQKVKEVDKEVKEFRGKAEELITSLQASMDQASAITDELSSSRAEVDQTLGVLEERRGALETALEELEQRKTKIDEDLERKEKEAVAAIDEERNRATKFIMEGLKDYEQSRYKAALESWERALEIDDQSPRAWNNKGAALWSLGRYEDALESHEKAIELDPNYAPAWLNKGVALLNLGRQEESLEASERAIGLDPEGADARYNKACAHGFLGDKPAMLDALKMAIERDSKWKEKAKTDSAFEPYRSDADFRALVFGEEGG